MLSSRLKALVNTLRATDICSVLVHTKDYLAGTFGVRALTLISLPVLTRLLTPADYGIISVFSAYVPILSILLCLNTNTSIARYYYEKTEDFDSFLGSTLLLVGSILSLAIPPYLIFVKGLGSLLELPGLLPLYLLVAALFHLLYEIYNNQMLVPKKKSKAYSVINVLKTSMSFGISVLLIYSLRDERYLGRIWSTLLVGGGFSVYFFIKILKEARIVLRLKHLRYILSYSIPLLPYYLSANILAQSDRIMINKMIDSSAAGLYSLAYNVGMLLSFVISTTQMALLPDFFRFLKRDEHKRLDSLVKKVFGIVAICALGLVLFSREIVVVLADKTFHAAAGVAPIVVVGYLFFAMFTIYGRYIEYVKKTIYSSVVAVTAGITNILLNAIFIPRYGYVAGAYTTVVSYFIMFLLAWFFARIVLKQETTPLWIVWKPTVIMFAFMGLFIVAAGLGLPLAAMLMIKLVLLFIFAALVFRKEIIVLYNGMKA